MHLRSAYYLVRLLIVYLPHPLLNYFKRSRQEKRRFWVNARHSTACDMKFPQEWESSFLSRGIFIKIFYHSSLLIALISRCLVIKQGMYIIIFSSCKAILQKIDSAFSKVLFEAAATRIFFLRSVLPSVHTQTAFSGTKNAGLQERSLERRFFLKWSQFTNPIMFNIICSWHYACFVRVAIGTFFYRFSVFM